MFSSIPPPSSFLLGKERVLPTFSGMSLGFAWLLGGLVLCLWGAAGCMVQAEITSHQTPSQRKALSGWAGSRIVAGI